MIAWKAVNINIDGTFKSWSSIISHDPIFYELGSSSKRRPGWGPLTAFKTLRHAKKFAEEWRTNSNYAIIKCSVTRSHAKRIWLIDEFGETRVGLLNIFTPNKLKVPDGTILCDSITPLEVVWRGNES